MSTAKHTPGPWKLSDEGQYNLVWSDELKDYVASVHVYDSKGHLYANADANAALISAAPDLLEALQAIVDEAGPSFGHTDGPGTINRMAFAARAAIAKATGGTP